MFIGVIGLLALLGLLFAVYGLAKNANSFTAIDVIFLATAILIQAGGKILT